LPRLDFVARGKGVPPRVDGRLRDRAETPASPLTIFDVPVIAVTGVDAPAERRELGETEGGENQESKHDKFLSS
jgi:hypothetical protein